MKQCRKCQIDKEDSEFSKNPTRWNPNNLRGQCKSCENEKRLIHYAANKDRISKRALDYQRRNPIKRKGYKLKLNYGVGIQKYQELLEAQNHRCAICKTDNPITKNKKSFCMDHDHVTGKIRGLLCDNCNKALGNFKDDTSNLQAAIEYLNGSK